MIFITLVRFRRRPTKADMAETDKQFAQQAKEGIKNIGVYWTLGRYDAVRIYEAPDERTVMRSLARAPDILSTETLVALKREDAVKLLE